MSNTRDKQKHQATTSAKIAGSSAAGILELLIFHPADTTAKRLMNNKTQVISKNLSIYDNLKNGYRVATGNTYQARSLYAGLGIGFAYKVSQRIYKYTAQKKIAKKLKSEHISPVLTEALAGALTGTGEALALSPFDTIKIMMQNNPELVAGRSIFQMLVEENIKLYKGLSWTIARNACGSFALFASDKAVKEYLFKLEEGQKASFGQHLVSSACATIPSLVVSSPFDVVKTRLNSDLGKVKVDNETVIINGRALAKHMLEKEGISAFGKGLGLKMFTVAPKVCFSFTIANFCIERADGVFNQARLFAQKYESKESEESIWTSPSLRS